MNMTAGTQLLLPFIDQIHKDLDSIKALEQAEKDIINCSLYEQLHNILDGLFRSKESGSDGFYNSIAFLCENPASKRIIKEYGRRTWKKALHVASVRFVIKKEDYASDFTLSELTTKIRGNQKVIVELADKAQDILPWLDGNVNEKFSCDLSGYNYIIPVQHKGDRNELSRLYKYGRTSNIHDRTLSHIFGEEFDATNAVTRKTENSAAGEQRIKSLLEENFLLHYDEKEIKKTNEIFYKTPSTQLMIEQMELHGVVCSDLEMSGHFKTLIDEVFSRLYSVKLASLKSTIGGSTNRQIYLLVGEVLRIVIMMKAMHLFGTISHSDFESYCLDVIGMEAYNAKAKADRLCNIQKILEEVDSK